MAGNPTSGLRGQPIPQPGDHGVAGVASRPTVLFVDDDELVCRSTARLLGRAGFDVTVVPSGEQALALVRSRHFDVVVTDHRMPAMSGPQLIERLLEQDPALKGRIILASGDLHADGNDELLERTGCRGLQKPFQLSELSGAVRAALAA